VRCCCCVFSYIEQQVELLCGEGVMTRVGCPYLVEWLGVEGEAHEPPAPARGQLVIVIPRRPYGADPVLLMPLPTHVTVHGVSASAMAPAFASLAGRCCVDPTSVSAAYVALCSRRVSPGGPGRCIGRDAEGLLPGRTFEWLMDALMSGLLTASAVAFATEATAGGNSWNVGGARATYDDISQLARDLMLRWREHLILKQSIDACRSAGGLSNDSNAPDAPDVPEVDRRAVRLLQGWAEVYIGQ
jgi:hypothetical protein